MTAIVKIEDGLVSDYIGAGEKGKKFNYTIALDYAKNGGRKVVNIVANSKEKAWKKLEKLMKEKNFKTEGHDFTMFFED